MSKLAQIRWLKEGAESLRGALGINDEQDGLHAAAVAFHGKHQPLADVITVEGLKRILRGEVVMPRPDTLEAIFEALDAQ